MKPKIRTIYVDYMRLSPNLTHLIDQKKLKDPFGFLVDPVLFGSEYVDQSKEDHPPRKFIHRLGSLRPLPPDKWRYPFWRNLFGGTSLVTYVERYVDGKYFGYLPYFITSTWDISIEPNSQTNAAITQILSQARISLTARLFPMGATAIHLMLFFTLEQAEVEQFTEIQKTLLNNRLFRVSERGSVSSNLLTLEEIFDEVQRLIYNSLFEERPKGTLEAQPGETHRVIYLDLFPTDGLTNDDIQMAAASLIGLNTVKTPQESVALMECILEGPKSPGDLLIFNPGATLFYTPNLDPHKQGFCLWNNYINVVEMATLQNFVLGKANHLLNQALSPNPNSIEFADRALFLKGLGSAHRDLRGGHKRLYLEIDKKLKLSKTVATFFNLLQSYAAYQSYNMINQQIQDIEKTLLKIKEVAVTIGFNQIGLLLVDDILDEASYLRNSLSSQIQTLGEIEARKRQGNGLPNDTQDENHTKFAIMADISKYREELLSNYEHIIGELLNTEEKAKIDITLARTKLEEAKLKGDSYCTYDILVFIQETRDYIKALLEAATDGLKGFS